MPAFVGSCGEEKRMFGMARIFADSQSLPCCAVLLRLAIAYLPGISLRLLGSHSTARSYRFDAYKFFSPLLFFDPSFFFSISCSTISSFKCCFFQPYCGHSLLICLPIIIQGSLLICLPIIIQGSLLICLPIIIQGA